MSWSPKNKSTRSSYSSSKLPLKKAVELKQECICHSCFQAVLEQKDVYDEKQNTDDKTVFICDHCEANISHFTQNKYHTCKDDTCKGILCPSCYRHYQNSYHELVQVSSVTFAGSEYKGITDIQFRYMNQSAEDVEPLPGGMGLSPIELEDEEYITEINGAFETIRKYTIELEFVTSLVQLICYYDVLFEICMLIFTSSFTPLLHSSNFSFIMLLLHLGSKAPPSA